MQKERGRHNGNILSIAENIRMACISETGDRSSGQRAVQLETEAKFRGRGGQERFSPLESRSFFISAGVTEEYLGALPVLLRECS